MSKSVYKILKSLADNITNKGYGIEGLELSYVDTKEKHLEVFTYSSDTYKKAFEEGFVKIGSLLFCDDTFKKSGVIIRDSKFRVISDNNTSNIATLPLVFSHFENPFTNENTGTKPTYSKWITHFRKSNLNGVFFFFGKRKISDFDLVLFGVIDGQNKKQLKKDVRHLLNKFTNELDDFSMVFERLRESRKDIIEQATRAAVAEIINRNYAHHIGSHVSHRATFEKILERLGISKIESITPEQLATIAKMRNRLEKYKDERSEFIASVGGIISSQSFSLYNDVIRPFLENTLIIDNIAANEGIRYFKKNSLCMDKVGKLEPNKNPDSLSQLVVRVFIHKELTSKRNFSFTAQDFRNDFRVAVPNDFMEQKVIYFKDKEKSEQLFDSTAIPYYLHTSDLDNTFYEHAEPLLDDIQINLPGSLGKHAIYSLLENYIRNTAKHAYKANSSHKDNPVEIILKLSSHKSEKDKITLDITDNLSDAVTQENEKTVVDKLSANIKTKLSDKQGMGIADMKISACLLAEKELTEENLQNSLIVSASPSGNLSYSMQLSKPKQIALIGFKDLEENTSLGIYKYNSIEEYTEADHLSFQFAIINGGKTSNDEIQSYKHLLPLRLFVAIEPESDFATNSRYVICNTEKIKSQKDLVVFCWSKWVEFKVGNKKTELSLFLEQKSNEYPTNEWGNVAEKFQSANFATKICNKNSIEVNQNNRLILYDRHAQLIRKATETKFINDNFWELIDKQNPDFDLIFSSNPKHESFILPFEMIDAALNNILVIDERVAEVANSKVYEDHQNEIKLKGFQKFNLKTGVTLFDYCWAAGVYVCTHLNGVPVHPNNNKENCQKEHFLDIQFEKNGNLITISSTTNFMQYRNKLDRTGLANQWKKENGEVIKECDYQDSSILNTHFDTLLIHRTKLKELIEDKTLGREFISLLDVSKIYIITGGGVVDFLNGKESKITILPTNILKDFIINGRIAKLNLNKILK